MVTMQTVKYLRRKVLHSQTLKHSCYIENISQVKNVITIVYKMFAIILEYKALQVTVISGNY